MLSFRHVTIRPLGLAQVQQSMASSVGVRVCMTLTVWHKPSMPPLMLLGLLYLSVLQAALRLEVKITNSYASLCVFSTWGLRYILFSSGASAFQAMQYLPHQQPGYPVHGHFTSQPGLFLFNRTQLQTHMIFVNCKNKHNILCRIHPWSRDTPPEAVGTR